MANLPRSAKSGNDWTPDDLEAYNIAVRFEDGPTFLGVEHASKVPQVDDEVLTKQKAEDMVSDSNAVLVNLLYLAMRPFNPHSAVNDFVVALLTHMGYVRRHRVARTHMDIPLRIGAEWNSVETDVCLVDCSRNRIILVVQENKGDDIGSTYTESRLIAGAIAAFDYNNQRRFEQHKAPLESVVIPGIVMVGTMPIFYKIPVTVALKNHVARGTYPSSPTVVTSYLPDVPRPARRYDEGMEPLENRQAILQSFEAFKNVVGI